MNSHVNDIAQHYEISPNSYQSNANHRVWYQVTTVEAIIVCPTQHLCIRWTCVRMCSERTCNKQQHLSVCKSSYNTTEYLTMKSYQDISCTNMECISNISETIFASIIQNWCDDACRESLKHWKCICYWHGWLTEKISRHSVIMIASSVVWNLLFFLCFCSFDVLGYLDTENPLALEWSKTIW
jgi:hypothetical protein